MVIVSVTLRHGAVGTFNALIFPMATLLYVFEFHSVCFNNYCP